MNQNNEEDDFLSLYLQYTSATECPTFFHRWTALSILAAWLGRSIYFPFGHFKVHCNMYCMFVALAGTKKSTAIKIGAALLESAGYKHFAARKTRQEKFLIDLSKKAFKASTEEDILDINLFGEDQELYKAQPPAESYVAADEINNFIGVGNLDFMSILGELWDYDGLFDYKLKNSDDVYINNPTVNILGGNTFTGFNKLFPPEAIEQGFFSRMLFLYAEPTNVKYTIQPEPSEELKRKAIDKLNKIKSTVRGKISISSDAYEVLDKIYKNWEGMGDERFDAYSNRRQIHLLKLCMICMANRLRTTIEKEDIIEANTILTYSEHLMPKALGEFGRAKNAEATHKVMQLLDKTHKPLSFQQLWIQVHKDLDKREQLVEILGNLTVANKVQNVGKEGYLPVKKIRTSSIEGTIDWSILTDEEKDMI